MGLIVRGSRIRPTSILRPLSRLISPLQPPSLTQRLVSCLAILEQRGGQLQVSSLGAFTAAHKLGGPVTGLIAGGNVRSAAEDAAKVPGVDRIIIVENGAYDKVRITSPSTFTARFHP